MYLQKKCVSQHLLERICRILGVREIWYFGLQYRDTKLFKSWLQRDKIVFEHNFYKEPVRCIKFLVKFYPEEISEEIIEYRTQHLFFMHVKESILSMDIYCPPEASVLLASYAVQIKVCCKNDVPNYETAKR